MATQWAFLFGFPAAVPLLLIGLLPYFRGPARAVWNAAWTALAFTAYYWGSVGLLIWRYEGLAM